MKVKNSYFSRYLGYKLLKHKVLLIVSLVANILALPLMSVILSSSVEGIYNLLITSTEQSRKSYEFERTLSELTGASQSAFLICVIVFAVLCVISLITPTVIMTYNYRRSDNDMHLSLPLTTRGRFFADALAGFVISVLPLAINFLGGFIFIGKGADILSANAEFFAKNPMSGIPLLTVNYAYDFFILASIVGIIVVSGIYFSSLFFASCTGKKSSSVIFSIAAPAILMGIGIYVSYLIMNTARGIMEWKTVLDIPYYIAPFGMLKMGWDILNEALIHLRHDGASVLQIPLSVIITHIVTSVLFFFGAYVCSVKRKAENTEKAFSIGFIYKAIITLFVVFMMSFIVSDNSYTYSVNLPKMIIGVAVALVIYLAVQLLHYKSVKKLPRLLLHFGVTAAVSMTAFILIAFSQGLGTALYMPSVDEIESVTVPNIAVGIRTENDIVLTEKEDIELIISLHKKCIEENMDTGINFGMIYKLKNGETVLRAYDYGDEETSVRTEVRESLLSSQAFMEQLLPENDNYDPYAEGSFILNDGEMSAENLLPDGVMKFIDAIRLDFKAGTLTKGKTIGRVELYWEDSPGHSASAAVFVKEGSENILKVLRDDRNYSKKDTSTYYDSTSDISEEEKIVVIIGNRKYDYNYKLHTDHFLYIRNKDLENEKVKELLSLIDFGENGYVSVSSYGIWLDSQNLVDHYCGIRGNNINRVSELIAEIKAERKLNNDEVDFTGFTLYNY